MLTVAYFANQFPASVEPYVVDEIRELRRRGIQIIAGSARKPERVPSELPGISPEPLVCLEPLRLWPFIRGQALAAWRWKRIACLVRRVLLQGREPFAQRVKAIVHTCLGAYYAALLKDRGVDHIHVHHGYFGSWIAMVAARLLGITFSMTLHGSDLLLNGAYLDQKLEHCLFCLTISGYNRRYILTRFPGIDPQKIIVSRLGVEIPENVDVKSVVGGAARPRFSLLAVGRLHRVKDHAFLIRACASLRDGGLDFECAIAGGGQERERLESLIRDNNLQDRVTLLGHVSSSEIDTHLRRVDVIVLTSRSEGVPLALMEAMARGKIVVAPSITGIPELVIPGKTGFLYAPGVLEDFVAKLLHIHEAMRGCDPTAEQRLDWIRHAARLQVVHNFRHAQSLAHFADQFLHRIAGQNLPSKDLSGETAPRRFPPARAMPGPGFAEQAWEDTA